MRAMNRAILRVMGKRRRRNEVEPPPARRRTAIDSFLEALPDLLAAGACALALRQPDWPGYDTLRTAGLLYFVELPVAICVLLAGIARVEERRMSAAAKASFILMPTLALAFISAIVLGRPGLIAVAWLSAGTFYRLLRGIPPRGKPIPGFWLDYTEGDDESPRAKNVRRWRVEGGPEEFAAAMTIGAWFFIALLMFLVSLPEAGVTAQYASSVAWSDLPVGGMVPPAKALWAGAILFGLRALSRIEGPEAAVGPPPARIEDDPVLRDIVRKVDSTKK
jgi:hypothetical protein